MTTATLQRELKKIAEKHEQLGRDLERLLVLASHEKYEKDLSYGDWKLKPAFIKQIEKARRDIRVGKGISFRNADDMQKYLRAMRHGN